MSLVEVQRDFPIKKYAVLYSLKQIFDSQVNCEILANFFLAYFTVS